MDERMFRSRIKGVRVDHRANELLLRRSQRQLFVALFLMVWLTGWTLGCLVLAAQAIAEPTFFHLAFALPFWGAWLLVATLLFFMLFGRERLRLARDGVHYLRSAIFPLARHHIPWSELRDVSLDTETVRINRSFRTNACLQLASSQQTIRFARGLHPDDARKLLDVVQSYLAQNVPSYRQSTALTEDGPHDTIWQTTDTSLLDRSESLVAAVPAEILHLQGDRVETPTESAFHVDRDWDHMRLTRRGQSNVLHVLPILFFVLFWNGFLVFISIQFGEEFDLMTGLILLPFVLVGLGLAAVVLGLLFRPLWKSSWTFHRHEIVTRRGLFGIGRSHHYEVFDLKHLELRQPRSSIVQKLAQHFAQRLSPGESDVTDLKETQQRLEAEYVRAQQGRVYTLAFVRRNGSDLLQIQRLSEAEARWIAHIVYGDFGRWFS